MGRSSTGVINPHLIGLDRYVKPMVMAGHTAKTLYWTITKRIVASPQQGDLRLSGPPSGQGASGGARTRDRRVPADPRAHSLATVPPTPPVC
ncbi:hypothetical protein PoB_007608500 [Plakobranchus ocellatus]|uniref:Uncharacterized protein n=1 Tax=Plakobranchus ocellatus TaxID=259542 RepID=A0AAV4E004_9GAST|nr:hypothetical protein PoB_007608500 [Plakobranchus ocellatus]